MRPPATGRSMSSAMCLRWSTCRGGSYGHCQTGHARRSFERHDRQREPIADQPIDARRPRVRVRIRRHAIAKGAQLGVGLFARPAACRRRGGRGPPSRAPHRAPGAARAAPGARRRASPLPSVAAASSSAHHRIDDVAQHQRRRSRAASVSRATTRSRWAGERRLTPRVRFVTNRRRRPRTRPPRAATRRRRRARRRRRTRRAPAGAAWPLPSERSTQRSMPRYATRNGTPRAAQPAHAVESRSDDPHQVAVVARHR